MKFKNDIEVQAGIKDSSGSDGTLGQVLSSTVSGVSWITPPVGVTGSGTTNFLPKWNSSTGLTDSIIFNNGNGVTIGATSSSPNSGWRLNIHPASTQAGLGIFCYNNNSLHGLRIEMTGTGDFIQARDVATQNDVFSVSYLGNTTANSFIKIGGTSSQYLMADGSISTGPSVSGFVPYTGANQNVNLGEYGLSGGYLTFDTTPTGTPTSQGTMYWDDAKSTVSLIMNGTIQHIGQDSFYYAKNSSGSSIPKGTAVRFAGTDGASGHILIAPMIANGTVPSSYYMGITSEAIANGAFGQVMAFGELEGVNTSAYTAGSLLYVSTTVAGGFQTTVPVAPNNIILAAATLNSKSNGALIVRATLGSNINSDEGVKIVSPTTGDLLQLQSNGLWENINVASLGLVPQSRTLTINGTTFDLSANRSWTIPTHDPVTIGTPANGLSITGQVLSLGLASSLTTGALSSTDFSTFNNKIGGSGTADVIPKFTGTSTLGNSNIFNVNNRVGIGTTSPSGKLDVTDTSAGNIVNNITVQNASNSAATEAGIFFAPTTATDNIRGARISGIQEDGNNAIGLKFYTGLGATISEKMRITSGGNVGIGTTSPTQLLDVNGKATFNGYGLSGDFGTNYNIGLGVGISGKGINMGYNNTADVGFIGAVHNGTSWKILSLQPIGGSVSIGTTTGGYTLYVNGTVAGVGAYNNLSDKRYKKDILPIENALDKILALNGVTFNWDKEATDMNLDDNNHIGLLAQDVEEIIPQAVTTGEDKNKTKSVAYTDLVPVLIEAIKELKAEIEILKQNK